MTPTELAQAFQTMQMQQPDSSWYMDIGSTSNLTRDASKLSNFSRFNKDNYILVGNGHRVPVFGHGNAITSYLNHPYRLNNVCLVTNIIKNLVAMKQFNRDNNTSVEFDPFGFTMKDLITKKHITQCDSHGDLYQLTSSPTNKHPPVAFYTESPNMWHN